MSERLGILYSQDRNEYPSFTTSELAETLNMSQKKVRALAKSEGWKEFELQEVDGGEAVKYLAWDGLSMPENTRLLLAIAHYEQEERECPLLVEVDQEAALILSYFPNKSLPAVRAALYINRQVAMVDDVASSLHLTIHRAIEVISHVYRISKNTFYDLTTTFSNNDNVHFFALSEDVRLVMLIEHYSQCPEEQLPNFSFRVSKGK
jgi:hypothetical protein